MPTTSFETFIQKLQSFPLLGTQLSKNDYVPLDLSICNSSLKEVDVSSSKALEVFIWDYLVNNNAKVAYGGYLEQRYIYRRSSYFNACSSESERNIHLGLDLWIDAGTPIYAPLDGTLHSFSNNTNYGDYGPTLVLKHTFGAQQFYTLYGHLSLESLEQKQVDDTIKAGEQIATLGIVEVNGDYPPHLHFQIIKDLQNYTGDYPGVCSLKDLDFYKENCPDANLLLNLT